MQSTPRISIHHLHYAVASDRPLFDALTLEFHAAKIGIVGKNGVGKTTLLKLITGELMPQSGSIVVQGTLAYCPQEPQVVAENTVADVLGVSIKLQALHRILQGSSNEQDLTLLNEDWMIETRLQQQLAAFGLDHLAWDRMINTLSGGETTRLLLAKVFFANPDFIVLDEPTNNLDATARELLYINIQQWRKGLLVVSHDRALLNLMNHTIELNSVGVNQYGGNYDFYIGQKNLLQDVTEREWLDAKKRLSKTQSSMQTTYEKHQQRQSYGRKLYRSGSIDKMAANSKRGRSERTQKRNAKQHEVRLEDAKEQLQLAKSKMEINNIIDIELPKTFVPSKKIMVEMKDLTFYQTNSEQPIIFEFNLKIVGPERIAIAGKNGSGKTTLIKLLLGKLTPMQGDVYLGTERISYLEQTICQLHSRLSILENFMRYNPEVSEKEAHFCLAQFLFKNKEVHKKVQTLSGGEKLRVMLACTLLSPHPPQLLILDEPTNHLDLASLTAVESALGCYQGTLLVISHDSKFLENIGITRFIQAPFV